MSQATYFDIEESWDHLMTTDILLTEVSMKLYMLKSDGPEHIRPTCASLEAKAEELSDGICELMEEIDGKLPLSETETRMAHYIEENARLRSTIKQMKKELPPSV